MKKKDYLFKNVSLSPYKYLTPSVRTRAYFIEAALIPHVIMLFLTGSFDSLIVLAAAFFASISAEALDFEKNRKDAFVWTISFIRGTVIGLLLPSTYPPLAVFFVTFVVLLVNRNILGGFANSWINPAAATIAICWLIGTNLFPPLLISHDDLQMRNPALFLIQNGTFPMLSVDARITNFLNNKVFGLLGVSIPDGYVSLFWDSKSVIPAFRFNLITIISSIILLSFNIYEVMIPGIFIFTYGVLVRFVAPVFYDGPMLQGDILLALLSSGTLFGVVFLLQWHGTIPLMNRGKILYGVISGILAFFIVGAGTSPAGFIFTILIMNVISPLIQTIENSLEKKYMESVVAKKVQKISDGVNA